MQGPEKVVCCTLCLCMAVAVLSSCSLVYLTFIVYLPAQKELMSGLLDRPVMCTTEERVETDDCEWASCWEWCLSKPSTCTHINVSVRRNGSEVVWRDCSPISDTVCRCLNFLDKMLSTSRTRCAGCPTGTWWRR